MKIFLVIDGTEKLEEEFLYYVCVPKNADVLNVLEMKMSDAVNDKASYIRFEFKLKLTTKAWCKNHKYHNIHGPAYVAYGDDKEYIDYRFKHSNSSLSKTQWQKERLRYL